MAYKDYSEEAKARKKARDARWRQNNRKRDWFNHTAFRSKRDNIAFDLTEDDFIVPEYCPVLGIKLEFGLKRYSDNSPSIDRIDPTKGYVKGNVIVISRRANTIKNNATVDELFKIARFYEQLGKL